MKKFIYYFYIYLSLVLFLVLCYSNIVDIAYYVILLFHFILLLLTLGVLKNKGKYNTCLIIYMSFLMCLTLFMGRLGIGFINKDHFSYYINSYNIVPFLTIGDYFSGNYSLIEVIYNIVGNMIIFVPISLILIYKDKKYLNTFNQLIYLGSCVLFIEILQFLLSVGRFDIDDFILNILGCILFIKLFDVFSLYKIKFNINNKIIYILILFVLLFDVFSIKSFSYYFKNKNNKFYLVDRVNCNGFRESVIGDINLNLNCIYVYYKSDNGYVSIANAFEKNIIDYEYFKYNVPSVTLINKDYEVYSSNNINFVYCNKNKLYVLDSLNDYSSICELNK